MAHSVDCEKALSRRRHVLSFVCDGTQRRHWTASRNIPSLRFKVEQMPEKFVKLFPDLTKFHSNVLLQTGLRLLSLGGGVGLRVVDDTLAGGRLSAHLRSIDNIETHCMSMNRRMYLLRCMHEYGQILICVMTDDQTTFTTLSPPGLNHCIPHRA
jgi:hypothetical protein